MSILFEPQVGKQTLFLSASADIVLYGGAMGGGKSYALLLDHLHAALKYPHFRGIIFRRHATNIRKPGGLWDESCTIYPFFGGKGREHTLEWLFENGSKVTFGYIPTEQDKLNFLGAQFDVISFDETTEFVEDQIWFLQGRLRSRTGFLNPYCRMTCNPDPDSWIANLVEWWIGEDGFPIPSRTNVVRWMINMDDQKIFFDDKNECVQYIHDHAPRSRLTPKSFTFIPATIDDNPILLKNNPNYVASLSQMKVSDRMRYLYGNWKFKPKGNIFDINDFQYFYNAPAEPDLKMILIDTAMEVKTQNDFTVMQGWSRFNQKIYLEEQVRGKFDFGKQLDLLVSFILSFCPHYVGIEKAAHGTALLQEVKKRVPVNLIPITRKKDKYTRAWEANNFIQSGHVYICPNGDYFRDFVQEIHNFSQKNENNAKIHDDQVDPMVDAIDKMLIHPIGHQSKERPKRIQPYAKIPIFRST